MLKIDSVNFSHERSEPLAAYREVDCSPSRPTIFFESKSCVIFNAGPTDYWSGVLLIDTGNRCPSPEAFRTTWARFVIRVSGSAPPGKFRSRHDMGHAGAHGCRNGGAGRLRSDIDFRKYLWTDQRSSQISNHWCTIQNHIDRYPPPGDTRQHLN